MSDTDPGTQQSLPENNALVRGIESLSRSDETEDTEGSPGWFDRTSYRYFGERIRQRETRFQEYRQLIDQARMDDTYDEHLAKTVFLALLMTAVGAIMGLAGGGIPLALGLFDQFSTIVALALPVAATIGGAVIFGGAAGLGMYFRPHQKSYSRSREINALLPQTVTYIYAHSQGGMHLVDIINRLAEEEEAYGEIAVEFQAIRNNMEFFGADLTTALQDARNNTPNDEFARLLDDIVSYVNTGGDLTSFLENKTTEFQRKARQREESILETLDLVSQVYIILGVVLPIAALVIFVVMSTLGGASPTQLYAIVYLGVPILGVLFVVIHSSITGDISDELKTLSPPTEPLDPDVIEARLNGEPISDDDVGRQSTSRSRTIHPARPVYSRIDGHERQLSPDEKEGLADLKTSVVRQRAVSYLKTPLRKVRENPLYSIVFSLPVALLYIAAVTITGVAPVTPTAMTTEPVHTTTFGLLVPLIGVLAPVSYLHEVQYRFHRNVEQELPTMLRKLATVNTSGTNLIDNISLVASSSTGVLAEEMEKTENQLQFNISLNDALTRFANRIENPRVTRVTKLLMEANTTSGRVNEVLTVAASAEQDQVELDERRLSGMKQRMAIILIGFVVFLAIACIVIVWLFPSFESASASAGGSQSGLELNFNTGLYTMIFYHGTLIQALVGGTIAGKFGYDSALSGLKFVIAGFILSAAVFLII